jgi:hypothetical protein
MDDGWQSENRVKLFTRTSPRSARENQSWAITRAISKRGLGSFDPAIVLRVQAAGLGLFLVLQQQDLVDDRYPVCDLDLHQRLAHRFADVLGMSRCAAQG